MFWLSDTYHTKIKMLVFTSNWHFSWLYRHKRRCKNRACLVFWRQRWEMVSRRLGHPKCFVVNMAVHEWSCLSGISVHDFQDLPIQFGQVLNAKISNRCCTLLVGLGGPTLVKKSTEWQPGVFPCHGMAELPRICLGMNEGTWKARDWPSSNGWSATGGEGEEHF